MPSRSEGFTLIELLIVIVIIAILAAIAIPSMFGTRERALVATMKYDLRNVATAQEAYFVDFQLYAPSTAVLGNRLRVSTNVSVTIDSATGSGWGATATHSQSARSCNIAASPAGNTAPVCP